MKLISQSLYVSQTWWGSHQPRLRSVVPLGHRVGQINAGIDITSAVRQPATRCLLLGVGFPGQPIRRRHCRGRNCSTRATIKMGIGPHSGVQYETVVCRELSYISTTCLGDTIMIVRSESTSATDV